MNIDPEDLTPELREAIVPKEITKQDTLDALAALSKKVENAQAEMSVAEAERALRAARAAESRRRYEQEKLLPKDPVVLDWRVFRKESDVYADFAKKPRCDEPKSANYPSLGTCTRPKGHLGEHGQPNWTGHLAIMSARYGLVEVGTRNAHGGATVHFESYEQFQAVMAELNTLVKAAFDGQEDDA